MLRLFTGILFLACSTLPAYAQLFGVSTIITEDQILVADVSDDESAKVFVFSHDPDLGWQHTGELVPSDPQPGTFFGYFLQAHGDHVFVGAPGPEAGTGAIYVFGRDPETGELTETAKITGSQEDHIGGATVFTDNLIVTGGMRGGSYVTVFEGSGSSWERTGSVSAEGLEDDAWFGAGLATGHERLYVGAPNANDGAGAVYVFSLLDMTQQGMLTAGDTALAALGTSLLPVNSSTLLAGAPGALINSAAASPPPPGAVVRFVHGDDGTWAEAGTMYGEGGEQLDLYGLSMTMDYSRLLVSAAATNQFQGKVYEFELGEVNDWTASDTLAPVGTRLFGLAMALEGDLLVITTRVVSNSGLGAAYVFRHTGGGWVQEAAIDSGREPPAPETAAIDMVPSDGPSECADSLAWQFGCSNVDLLAYLPISAVGGSEGITVADIWGWTDPETGREYALLGRSNGTSFIDITSPASPVYLGDLPMTEGSRANVWRDIKVYKNHVFVVADNAGEHGMQVFDLTQLRTVEDDLPATFQEIAVYDGIHSAHNIVINEETGYAFAVGTSGGGETCGGGLHMINIQDPRNPSFAGCFSHEGTGRGNTGYSHDAQCVVYHGPDTRYSDKEICLGSNETALSIADVTDKDNPVVVGSATYPNSSYAHQGWLTDDHRYFYMNDELDELSGNTVGTRTLIWDLTDLSDPLLVSEFTSENLATDHNLYIQGDVMYQANYKSGLRIFDISDRANPTMIGFFDTYPGSEDSPGFDGAWSSFPYFESGTIVVSSLREGLFVLKRQRLDI